MKRRNESASPCATCPFLRANFGRPNPEGYDPKKAEAENPEQRFFDWYSEQNLRRLWTGGLSKGEAMICHATDPHADRYGGKPAAPGCERVCIGALAAVFLHAKFVEALIRAEPNARPAQTLKTYRAAAGRFPMTRGGLVRWTLQINEGRAGANRVGLGGLVLPASLSASVVESVGVPWLDPIVNRR